MMTAAGETTEQHSEATGRDAPGHAVSAQPEPSRAKPVTGQQRAHQVLAELLDQAATRNLPAIDWTLTAFEPRLLGRCTAYPGPGRRRADFEAWRALLGAEATEERSGDQPVRLIARTERDEGRVTIEIAADLYDDVPDATSPAVGGSSLAAGDPSAGGSWRSP